MNACFLNVVVDVFLPFNCNYAHQELFRLVLERLWQKSSVLLCHSCVAYSCGPCERLPPFVAMADAAAAAAGNGPRPPPPPSGIDGTEIRDEGTIFNTNMGNHRRQDVTGVTGHPPGHGNGPCTQNGHIHGDFLHATAANVTPIVWRMHNQFPGLIYSPNLACE